MPYKQFGFDVDENRNRALFLSGGHFRSARKLRESNRRSGLLPTLFNTVRSAGFGHRCDSRGRIFVYIHTYTENIVS